MEYYSIAIDGPAGCGKSTVAKKVAFDLNFEYINSGLLYRAIAIYCERNRVNYENENVFAGSFFNNVKLRWQEGIVYLNDEKINNEANSQQFSNIASIIAQYPTVRAFVNKTINETAEKANVVVDGRDIGTLVLPRATAKIFLDADITTRALRRLKQNAQLGVSVGADMSAVISDIIERDNRDYTRPIAPLAKAEDAYILDCSDLSIDETVEKIKREYMRKVTNADWKD